MRNKNIFNCISLNILAYLNTQRHKIGPDGKKSKNPKKNKRKQKGTLKLINNSLLFRIIKTSNPEMNFSVV